VTSDGRIHDSLLTCHLAALGYSCSMTANRKTTMVLIAGDVLVYLIFAFGGRETHEAGSGDLIGDLIRILIPFIVTWFVVAVPIGLYRLDVIDRPRRALSQTLIASLIANPLAILFRAFLLGRTVIPTSFFVVTLGLTTTLLLIWRGGYAVWRARRSKN
jgi:hypothetical protein